MSKKETYRYHVTTRSESAPEKVPAAYYVHEAEFTVFKAEDGGIVASFRNAELVSVVREVTSCSPNQPISASISGPVTNATFNGQPVTS
jgi:hypothetical protein